MTKDDEDFPYNREALATSYMSASPWPRPTPTLRDPLVVAHERSEANVFLRILTLLTQETGISLVGSDFEGLTLYKDERALCNIDYSDGTYKVECWFNQHE